MPLPAMQTVSAKGNSRIVQPFILYGEETYRKAAWQMPQNLIPHTFNGRKEFTDILSDRCETVNVEPKYLKPITTYRTTKMALKRSPKERPTKPSKILMPIRIHSPRFGNLAYKSNLPHTNNAPMNETFPDEVLNMRSISLPTQPKKGGLMNSTQKDLKRMQETRLSSHIFRLNYDNSGRRTNGNNGDPISPPMFLIYADEEEDNDDVKSKNNEAIMSKDTDKQVDDSEKFLEQWKTNMKRVPFSNLLPSHNESSHIRSASSVTHAFKIPRGILKHTTGTSKLDGRTSRLTVSTANPVPSANEYTMHMPGSIVPIRQSDIAGPNFNFDETTASELEFGK